MESQGNLHQNDVADSFRSARQEVYSIADKELLGRLITETDETGVLFTALRDAGTAAKKEM